MSNVTEAPADARGQGNRGPEIDVAGLDLQFRTVRVPDSRPMGRDIVAAAGLAPGEDYIVLRWNRADDLEDIDIDRHVELAAGEPARLIIARSDREFVFELEGKRERWPVPFITVPTLKRIGEKSPDDVVVIIEYPDGRSDELDDDARIDLAAPGVEKFLFRPAKREVEIFVNTKPVHIKRGRHTGLQIKETAIAQGVNIKPSFLLYLVKHDGTTERIEDGERVPVRNDQNYDAIDDDDNS